MKADLVAFKVDWRSVAEQRWIPAIVCLEHLQMLQQRVPIRVKGETVPISECQCCIAKERARKRLQLEGRIDNSPIRDGITPSERKKSA